MNHQTERLIHILLCEEVGSQKPPDVTQRVLKRALPGRSRPGKVALAGPRPATPRRGGRRKMLAWAAGLAAAAACLAAVLTWFWPHGGPVPGTLRQDVLQRPLQLAAGWQVEPTGDALYEVVKPDRINLRRGELLVESRPPAKPRNGLPALVIETPAGTARAAGTRFYIGTHFLNPSQSKGEVTMTSFTRVLVLAGVVTLTNTQGSVTGQADRLLAAENGKAPTSYAVTANSDFAVDLYRQLSKENADKNLFFSPYSISSVLAMTAEGARGQTALEMGKVLCFPQAARRIGDDAQLIPWNTALIHTGMVELSARLEKAQQPLPKETSDKIAELRKQIKAANARADAFRLAHKGEPEANWYRQYAEEFNKGAKLYQELHEVLSHVNQYEVHVANALWGEQTHPFLPAYVGTIHKYYRTGGLFPVDFKNNHEAARQEINAWVEKQTADKIKDLVPPGGVDKSTRLVLTNAIYFLGNWSSQFEQRWTRDRDFSVSADKRVKTPLMHITKEYRYAAADSVQVLELPYKGNDLSMLVLLPKKVDGLADLEKSLSAATLAKWRAYLRPQQVNVALPKFKLETTYQLNPTLEALGMKRAFVSPPAAGAADFSGIDGGTGYLYISLVIHKAFVDVNETGTEAAAATVAVEALGMEPRQPPVVFHADHPFLFLICDNRSGSILFLGRLINPKD